MQAGADITIHQLSISYASHSGPLPALQTISTSIASGEFVAIIGPSGCGKSTLLRAVGGLLAPDSGQIRIGSQTAEQARRARTVGFVFQQAVLLPWHTAVQNVELPLRLFGWPTARRQAAAWHVLALVGLESFARAYPYQLSGGMQQRVALARALSFTPSVLLMDEPFGALDEITREQMNTELLQVWSSTGCSVLFVTHSLSEAAFLADRVLVLSRRPGQLIADIPIALPRPRSPALLEQEEFLRMVAQLRHHLHAGIAVSAQPEDAP